MSAINGIKGPDRASTPSAERRTPNDFSLLFPDPIQVLRPDLILVDYGPMTLTVSAWTEEEARPVIAVRAAALALELLEELTEAQALLKTPAGRIRNVGTCPNFLRKAVRACGSVSPELTGLAAVAGLVADRVLEETIRLGADRVIVNNGGDIALFTSGNQKVKVGLKTHPEGEISHFLEIAAKHIVGGVATSGWSGRSFSIGVADIVTVWAGDCTTADAAATWIAAQTDVNSTRVSRAPAGDLDPETDIPLLEITREVGRLTSKEKEVALETGLAEAGRLGAKGIIRGAFLAVQGETRWIGVCGGPELKPFIRKTNGMEP